MSGIDSDLIRGHIDTIILKSLYHGDKYGLEIIQEVEEKSNGTYELKQPTLYSCLKRLEGQGLISSYWEDSDIGGRRHYYTLTDKGRETYQNNQEDWLRSREIIDNLIYNTSVNYAPIYDDDKSIEKSKLEEVDNKASEESQNENVKTENTPVEENSETEKPEAIEKMQDESANYLADTSDMNEQDEFATFDDSSNQSENFFTANKETSENDDIEETTASPISVKEIAPELSDEEHDVVNLNLDENIDNEDNESAEEVVSNTDNNPSMEVSDDDAIFEEKTNDDDEIYSPENDIPEDEQIYVPENIFEEDNEEPTVKEQEDDAPTYINFNSNNNYDEADITNIQENQDEPANEPANDEFKSYNNNEIEHYDNSSNFNYEINNEETNNANVANEPVKANEEEINNLYKTTENYNNIQAGYTDEKYKQALSELESYAGGINEAAPSKRDKSNIYSFSELRENLEKDGITVKKYERQLKESDESKMYIKTNQIHLIKNWIVWGSFATALMLVFIIMNAFKSTYTYQFAFWPFAVAIFGTLIIPVYTSIKYAVNPYKKVIAKYAPRLNILINLLITVQLVIITYCINLQAGFYSFTQENYNHLIWVIPLILSFIPIAQAFTYMGLFNSKKFHA